MGKDDIIGSGKTKKLRRGSGQDLIMENLDNITKNDNPNETEVLPGKGAWATTTTCAVFRLLKEAGLPVAFTEQLSETEFAAPQCKMIMLEVIARRYAVGSYTQRLPHLKRNGAEPHRFHRLVIESFLKTTGGKITDINGEYLGVTPLNTKTNLHIDDPLIADMSTEIWRLMNPKLPAWSEAADLGIDVSHDRILPKGVTMEQIEELTRKAFLVLEGAFAQLGLRLIDFKIEFGIGPDGQLLIADVIDNDSWRLRTWDWQELSKQLFRDCESMDKIAKMYELVASLVQKFRIPNQAIIIWRGSDSDPSIEVAKNFAGVTIEQFVGSGHKKTGGCLNAIESFMAKYPEGGVFLIEVGKSDGLGPVTAARAIWPTFAIPSTAKDRPHDVWSSLEMPSGVPLLTCLDPKNAVLAALNVLAQKNPAVYAFRQYAIEALDPTA